MSIETMKQALEALELGCTDSDGNEVNLVTPAITALRQAIEQAEKQEPVAWIVDGEIKVRLDMAGKLYYSETNVYSAPPKREWAGLTDEEIFDVADNFGSFKHGDAQGHKRLEYAKAIEAKLKERNNT